MMKLLAALLLFSVSAHQGVAAQSGQSDAQPSPLEAVAPELRAFAEEAGVLDLNADTLAGIRAARAARPQDLPSGVTRRNVQGTPQSPKVDVLIFDPSPELDELKPAYLLMHGGGYVLGTAAASAAGLPPIAEACECVVVSVDYRLAPETPFPGPMEDNFSALAWIYTHSDELGIDPTRIAIGGASAGGGHAAQLSFAARERGIPVVFQVLIYPMIDDRTGGSRPVPAHIGHYIWNSTLNQYAWNAYLGREEEGEETPDWAVPAREDDLTNLPPTWIGTGSVDLFFAENLEYARRLGEAGVPVEVMVLPGGVHAFDIFVPDAEISKQFTGSWQAALYKALHGTSE